MIHKRDAKDWAKEHLRGLWSTPTIPFESNEALSEKGIRHNVDRMVQARIKGIGFGFSEPWVLSIEERKRAMNVSVDAIDKRVCSYLHTTDHSVQETINLTLHAQETGADAVMIWTPFEWAKDQNMICEYFEYIASKVDIAIFAYNTYHSGICMTPETVLRLAKIPNVCALKDAINDVSHTVRCAELAGDLIVVSDPLEDHLLTMTVQHGQQAMLGTTSLFLMQSPTHQPIQDYFELARDGKVAQATQLHQELQPLRDIWTGIYQVLWEKEAAKHPLPLIKYWMDLIGMSGGQVRPPMINLNGSEKAAFKARLDKSGWMEKLYPASSK